MCKQPSLTAAQDGYYGAFLLSMVICWSPLKALAYFAPVLAIVWFLWRAECPTARRRAMQWTAGWTILIFIYWVFSRRFDLTPAVIAIITYGTIGAIYIIPCEAIRSPRLLVKMLSLVAIATTIEATVGIVQAVVGALETGSFDLANGDAVQGTIFPSFHTSLTFANPMFAVNMAFMLLGLIGAAALAKKWRGTVLLGILAFVLASVMHAILLLAAAAVAGYCLCQPRLSRMKSRRFIVLTVGMLILASYIFLGGNVLSIGSVVNQAVAGQSPRAIILVDSITTLPQEFPSMPFVGLGPGQFSSNAALIASGSYYGGGQKSLPFIQPQSSPAFDDFLSDLMLQARDPRYGGSITVEPFFSWLSVYTEFGFPCLIAVFWWVTVILLRVRREALAKEQRLLGAAVVAGIVFFVLLGFQADYWEVPQAVLIGALLTKAMYAVVVSTPQKQIDAAAGKSFGTSPQVA